MLTGAKSESADTFRTRRDSDIGASARNNGDAVSLISLSVMLRKRAYVSMCLVVARAVSAMRNRRGYTIENARYVDIVRIKEFLEGPCALTGR